MFEISSAIFQFEREPLSIFISLLVQLIKTNYFLIQTINFRCRIGKRTFLRRQFFLSTQKTLKTASHALGYQTKHNNLAIIQKNMLFLSYFSIKLLSNKQLVT